MTELIAQFELPVVAVRHETQIREWFFGRARTPFDASEKVRKVDKKVAIAFALVNGKRDDA